MALKFAVAIQKGGSGKTTTAVNVGAGLALRGFKVLLVDIDPQGNLTHSLGVYDPEITINEAIAGEHPLPIVEVKENLSLVPATISLAESEMKLFMMMRREEVLKNLLKPIEDNYDLIFIDCPPSIGMLTINALAASDRVLIPLQAQYLAASGYKMLKDFVEYIKKTLNPGLELSGVFINQFESQRVLDNNVRASIDRNVGDTAYKTIIRKNVSLAEAPAEGKDIFSYAPFSNGALDYEALIGEILNRENIVIHE